MNAKRKGTAREHRSLATGDINSLTKEATDIHKRLSPYRALLQKYPDGTIPQKEFESIWGGKENPYALDDNGPALLRADLARLAEIKQQKQRYRQ